MDCPRCNTQLHTDEYEGVLIKACGICKGEWLDDGELNTSVQQSEEHFPAEMVAGMDAINENIFQIQETDNSVLRCPICENQALTRYNYASSSGVLLDKCENCKGVWLDKEELEKVQILVEEWRKRLEEDLEIYGSMLEKIRVKEEADVDKSIAPSRFGFVNAILRRFYRYFD